MMKTVNHPNICKVIEIIKNDNLENNVYLIMDYLSYPTL